jgi:hypothetical protein
LLVDLLVLNIILAINDDILWLPKYFLGFVIDISLLPVKFFAILCDSKRLLCTYSFDLVKKSAVFWDVTPCTSVVQMEATHFSET